MSLESALEALKRKDFAAARALIGADDGTFDVRHFQIRGVPAYGDWQSVIARLAVLLERGF